MTDENEKIDTWIRKEKIKNIIIWAQLDVAPIDNKWEKYNMNIFKDYQ